MRSRVSQKIFSCGVLWMASLSSACSITGLPGNLTMGELDSSQAVQVCETTQDFQERELSAEERKSYSCNLAGVAAGIIASTLRASYEDACAEARMDCMNSESNDEETGCENASFPENCDATIAQYESCQRDTVRQAREYNASFSCSPPEENTGTEEDEDENPCSVYIDACYGG